MAFGPYNRIWVRQVPGSGGKKQSQWIEALSLETSNRLAEAELQTVFGERLLKKPEWLARQRPLASLRIGVGRHEYAAYAQALADLVGGLNPIAQSNKSNIHEHHIWTFL